MKLFLLLMILLKGSKSLSNEYFLDTCCSLNGHERIYLSCGFNEKIHLNLIEIFYNSDEYCSSESYCCKYQTQCSRRITKYSSLHCDEQNSCWIDKSCLKIYKTCSNLHEGLYGQYLTIHYSCLPLINQSLIEQTIPFIVKLLASQTQEVTTTHSLIKQQQQQIFISNQLKSSPIFLILIIFLFIFFMLFMYWLAHWISQRICQQQRRRRILKMSNEKEQLIPQKLLIEHSNDQRKVNVQSNYSLPQIRISSLNKSPHSYYDQQQYSYRSIPYSPYRQYINVQHNPITGQITSRTFNNNYSNYY